VLARVMADADCVDVQLVDGPDAGARGDGIAAAVERAAEALDLVVAATERFPEAPASVLPLAARIARENAGCVVMGATTDPRGAAALVRGVHDERPAMRFFAPSSLGEPAFLRALGPAVEDQVRVITPLLPLHAYPRAAQRFLRAFAQRYGRPPAIEAIYGYEAMKAVLHAIGEAGDLGNDRAEVVKEFFAIRDRRSVLGTYDIDENGDTTLSQHAVHRVRAGRLLFDGVVRPGTG
jgi:branched-chain amino acid transport system substrate-binding protein